jgi:hypothetical protein
MDTRFSLLKKHGDTGLARGQLYKIGGIDSLLSESISGHFREHVHAACSDEFHLASGSSGSHRTVGSSAATENLNVPTQDGLTSLGDGITCDNQIRVIASYDQNTKLSVAIWQRHKEGGSESLTKSRESNLFNRAIPYKQSLGHRHEDKGFKQEVTEETEDNLQTTLCLTDPKKCGGRKRVALSVLSAINLRWLV